MSSWPSTVRHVSTKSRALKMVLLLEETCMPTALFVTFTASEAKWSTRCARSQSPHFPRTLGSLTRARAPFAAVRTEYAVPPFPIPWERNLSGVVFHSNARVDSEEKIAFHYVPVVPPFRSVLICFPRACRGNWCSSLLRKKGVEYLLRKVKKRKRNSGIRTSSLKWDMKNVRHKFATRIDVLR